MFQSIGTTEVIVVGVVILLIFGGRKIPEFFKGLGDAVKEFKRAAKEPQEEEEKKS